MQAILVRLIDLAKSGDLRAIREVLDRTIGKPKSTDDLLDEERTAAELNEIIEQQLQRIADQREANKR